MPVNDINICVATANGSGSASSNNILFKSIFHMGIPCSSKNMFPSNIQGLPTWYQIRASAEGFMARKDVIDVMVIFNPATETEDVTRVRKGGMVIYDSTKEMDESLIVEGVQYVGVPAEQLVKDNVKAGALRKKMRNMVYVGAVAGLFNVSMKSIEHVLKATFGNKPEVIESNLQCIKVGFQSIEDQNIAHDLGTLKEIEGGNKDKIIIEGNTAAALGCIFGGVSVVSWYPITPSSSLAEAIEQYLPKLRPDKDNKKSYAVIQAEDEIAAAGMVLGANWAGARSMTCTSGPGLSLMNEMVGLSYFGEVPCNIFIIQRGGPSTGLPTRTQQSDLLSMYTCSHGDTKHPVLIPYDMKTNFELSRFSFDLAERLQTTVFFASDLDLGMNLWVSDPLEDTGAPLDRGEVLSEEDLKARGDQFARFMDEDGDGVAARTIPGNMHRDAAYFTSGALQNSLGRRSEHEDEYRDTLLRVRQKLETARDLIPPPVVLGSGDEKIGFIALGSSVEATREAVSRLNKKGTQADILIPLGLPLHDELYAFIEGHQHTYLVEQNRDGQVLSIIRDERPELSPKLSSIKVFNGLPITAGGIIEEYNQIGEVQ